MAKKKTVYRPIVVIVVMNLEQIKCQGDGNVDSRKFKSRKFEYLFRSGMPLVVCSPDS